MAGKDGDEKDAAGAKKGGKLKLIIMLAPTLLLIVGAAWFFFLKPAPSAQPAKPPPPVPGPVVKLDSITINLAGGHFLKLGLSLQPTADAGEEVSGAKALDDAISLFSGKTVDELSTTKGREAAKKELVKDVAESYEKKVYDIYFTEFVMQ
jgi:flagellar protein FliL